MPTSARKKNTLASVYNPKTSIVARFVLYCVVLLPRRLLPSRAGPVVLPLHLISRTGDGTAEGGGLWRFEGAVGDGPGQPGKPSVRDLQPRNGAAPNLGARPLRRRYGEGLNSPAWLSTATSRSNPQWETGKHKCIR